MNNGSGNLSKMARLLGRMCKLSFVNPRGLREVCGHALAQTEGVMDPEIDVLPLPKVYAVDLHDGGVNPWGVNVRIFPAVTFSVTLLEAMSLGVLMRRCNARRVFEFGTHRGVSTSQLAANVPADGEVFTLDLPRADTQTYFKVDCPAEKEVANFPVKGDLIPKELREKVRFLEQDSARFDPKPYAESMDFIFVDAAHTMDYVVNDSEKAWAMLRPGGILAWHDCRAQSPDVIKYRRRCAYKPSLIADTTIAFAEKPAKA